MTKQELFTKSVTALLKQGCRAVRRDTCQYLTEDGYKCAIGHLLTEEELDKVKDLQGSLRVMWDKGLMPDRFEEHFEFLKWLQQAHDNADDYPFEEAFLDEAESIARKYNLVMP